MLPGTIDFASPVIAWRSRVTVDGTPVEHLEWDVDRVMCHVPGDTDSAGRSADATVKPAPAGPVVTSEPTPWQPVDGWPPKQGQRVTIEVSQDGTNWFPVMTGLVDKPSGTLSGDMSVDVIEKIDNFSRTIELNPFQWQMFPSTPGGALRQTDLHHHWYVNRAMEVAGFWTTMAPSGTPVLRVSMQGSRWPEIGDVLSCTLKGADGPTARAYSPWGSASRNFTAKYQTRTPVTGVADLRVMVPSGQISSDIPSPSGSITVKLAGPNGSVANLSINSGLRTASITNSSGRACYIGDITDIVGVRRSGTTWTLYTETTTASGSGGPESSDPISYVTVDADEKAAVGAIQLMPGSGAFPPVVWAPTGVITPKVGNLTALSAATSVNEQCAALMDAIGTATLSHWGFDETGRAIFLPIIGRFGIAPVSTISDDTDIIDDVTWSQDWQAAASTVHVDLKVPQRRWSTQPSIELWDSGGGTLAPGETAVDVIHPDDDVDWIAVDPGHALSGPNSADKIWNGSIFVGSVDLPDAGSGPDDRPAVWSEYSGSVAYVDESSYTITRQAKSALQISEQTGDWSWLPKSLRKRSTPIVRGYQKTTWVDGWIDTADNGTDAPVYTWDFGYWAGSNGSVTAQWLADLLQVDRVTLSELEIRPDPRLQLGDNVTLDLTSAGVTLTGMITGKHLSFSDGILSMTITVLVTASQVDRVRWAAFEHYMSGRQYAALEGRNSSYTALETDPLDVMGGS